MARVMGCRVSPKATLASDMKIRPARPEDAPSVAVIHVDAWRAAYVGLVPQAFLVGLSVESRTAMWQRAFAAPGPAVNLVAEDADQQINGFCVYGPSRDADAQGQAIGELAVLYVQPDRWRTGVGLALWSDVLAGARLAGWSAVTLWVLHGNLPARNFYEKLGFVADGAEKRSAQHTGGELHEVRYRLDLASDG
jgi:L-amino acid N-acyltransferase YncA